MVLAIHFGRQILPDYMRYDAAVLYPSSSFHYASRCAADDVASPPYMHPTRTFLFNEYVIGFKGLSDLSSDHRWQDVYVVLEVLCSDTSK
jgi:hypothetical protein